jgi:hypothetical protein
MNEEQKDMMFDQSEVNYTTLSNKRVQACANCRFFFPSGGCLIVESQPLSILATGYCQEWRALPEPEDKTTEMLETLEAIEHQLGVNNMSVGAMEKKPSLKERLLALVGIKARDEPFTAGFKALGNGKWIAIWSNNFEDQEREYFPAAATDAYIARLDAKEIDMPELYFWHVAYPFGRAKSIARIAADQRPISPSVSIAVGDFYETPIAKAFEQATLKSQKQYKMSHGYFYPENALINGVYHYYDTFELSVLPPYAAANPYTLFGDETMPVVSPEKQKELEALLGKDFAAEVVTKAEQRAKELKEQGVGYKDLTLIDTEARAQLDALTKQITELSTAVAEKAKMPMEDEMDEDGKKKKKADEEDAYKKEVSDAIKVLATSQKALADNFKAFLDMTPRRASKAFETLVPDDDPALKELAQGATGNKSNEEKIMNAAFSFMKQGGA